MATPSGMRGEYVSTLLEILLDQQPSLLEITRHARTAKWYHLGEELELDSVDLDGCTDLTSIYQLWIQEKAEMATRRNLLIALRSIRENNVARQYEDYLRTLTTGSKGILETTKDVTSLHVTKPIDTKKIIFDEKDLIGKGSQGTLVYKGSFGSIDVAVKRVMSKQFNDLVKREIDILQEHGWHPNIVRFYFMEEDVGFINIALELCDCTLFEFVKGSKLQHANGKALLFGAMKGVDHLHKFNIIHRDLKPQNVLLKLTPSNEVIPLISDFGLCCKLADDETHKTTKYDITGTLGWIAPEMSEDKSKVTRSVDIFAMGCIIYFVLSHGKHPFGRGECPFDPMSCQVKIKKKKDEKLTLSDLEGEDKCTAENLVRTMIKSNHELRPSSGEVLAHCLFWSKKKQLNFFQEVSDWIQWAFKNKPPGSIVMDDLEKGARSVFVNDWKDIIDEELKQDLEKTGKYDGTLVRDLLRAIRNKIHHYHELPETFKAKVHSPEGLVSYFTSQFPHLLIYTCKVMEKEPKTKAAKYTKGREDIESTVVGFESSVTCVWLMMATLSNDDNTLKSYKRAVMNVFTSYYAILNSVLEVCVEPFAYKAFAAGLISSTVMKNKTFSSIYDEFKVGLELCKSISEVQKQWKTLTDILEDLGGPASAAGRDLEEKLSSLTCMWKLPSQLHSETEKPTKLEVLNQLIPISSKWYVIGVGLQVNVNYLESMANSKLSNQVKLGKVIQRWLDMDGQDEGAPVTWNALIDVIKGPLVQNKALALTIHAYLRLEDSRQQSGGDQEKTKERESYTDEFSHFPKLSERPTRREVLTLLAPIDASWRTIGIGLRVSYTDLKGLAETSMSNRTKLNDVIQRWFDMDDEDEGAPVTWNALIDVIKGPLVQNKALAMKIYEYLKEESSVQKINVNDELNMHITSSQTNIFKINEWETVEEGTKIAKSDTEKGVTYPSLLSTSSHDDLMQLYDLVEKRDSHINDLTSKIHENKENMTILQEQKQQLCDLVNEKDSYIAELNCRLDTVLKEKEDELQQLKVTSHQQLSLRSSQKTTEYLIAAFAIIFLAVVINTIITVNEKTDMLHISKRVIGGTVDSVQWADSSFTMNIFANCFPKGHHVDVLVSIDHYFQLEVPKGYKVLSPKYQITTSERLQSPVSITLKHNAAVTSREVAESLAILYLSDEGEMKILQGKAEPNSTYITFQLSNLCHIVVIGLDHINQTYWLGFYRQLKSYETDPLLLIRCIIFPFPQSKDLEEELKNQGWIASDNSCTQELVGNGTVYLEVEPIECWNITGSTYNNSMTIKDQPVSSDIIMQYKRSNCDTHKSFIKFRNSYDGKIYPAFFGDKIILTQWDNFLNFIKDNVVGIGIVILIVILIRYLRNLKPEEELVKKVVYIIIVILILIFLSYYRYQTVIKIVPSLLL